MALPGPGCQALAAPLGCWGHSHRPRPGLSAARPLRDLGFSPRFPLPHAAVPPIFDARSAPWSGGPECNRGCHLADHPVAIEGFSALGPGEHGGGCLSPSPAQPGPQGSSHRRGHGPLYLVKGTEGIYFEHHGHRDRGGRWWQFRPLAAGIGAAAARRLSQLHRRPGRCRTADHPTFSIPFRGRGRTGWAQFRQPLHRCYGWCDGRL